MIFTVYHSYLKEHILTRGWSSDDRPSHCRTFTDKTYTILIMI